MTRPDGFDVSLAAVIARRARGVPCPHTGEVQAPLPADADDAAALVALALDALPEPRAQAILATLAAAGLWRARVTQLPLWDDARRAA